MARNHYVPHFQTINYYYTNLPTKKITVYVDRKIG